MGHHSRRVAIVVAATLVSVASQQFAHGAITVRRYDGSSSNNRWGTGANWSGGNVPNNTSETARYNGGSSGRTAINLNGADFTIGQIDFDNPTTAQDLQSSQNGSVLTVNPSVEAGYANVGVDMSNATKEFHWRKNSKNWQFKLGASQTWLVTGSGNLRIDNGVTVNLNNKTLTTNVGSGRTIIENGVISGGASSNIIKTGAGILRLQGSSTYSGNTTITGGQIDLDSGQIYSGSGTRATQVVTVDDGTTLRVQNFGKSTGGATSLGNLNLDAARVVVDGGQIVFTTTVTNGRGITIGPDGATLNVISGKSWTQNSSNANVYSPGAQLNLTGAGTGRTNNTIDGAGVSVVKNGAGTWTLGGANTYTGNTTINNGTLKLAGSGSVASSPLITVGPSGTFDVSGVGFSLASGQTIEGSGTVAGTMTIGSGAVISPGDSPGTMSTGSQIWADGGSELFEIDDFTPGGEGSDPGWDLVDITGTLDITATAGGFTIDIVSLLHPSHTSGDVFNFDKDEIYSLEFVRTSGGITGFDASDFTLDTSGFTNGLSGTIVSVEQQNNSLFLVFTPTAPEPSSLLLVAFAVTAVGAFGRRRKLRA